jgi:hypothetical protein
MTTTTEENVVTTPEEVQPQEVGLTLNEISGAVSIIDVCSERGAFKGPELAEVGTLRGKLTAFLDAHAQESQPTEGAEPTTEQVDG